jgi:peptidoglycan/xylan/chitin deacetylase (PgdA/CDA1 family)
MEPAGDLRMSGRVTDGAGGTASAPAGAASAAVSAPGAARVARVALKIDVDTFRGTRDGVPALLEDLAAAGVKASFFFTLGPDNSGRAVLRVFRKRGFLAKMLRTNAARMYGWRTALYGTLLPAPEIGRRCRSTMAAVAAAGHEVGLHAWDHVTWQDRLDRMQRAAIDHQLDRGIAAFEAIFGNRPRAFAAPAWCCTGEAFAALDARGFDYLSVSPPPPSIRGSPAVPWRRSRSRPPCRPSTRSWAATASLPPTTSAAW